MFSIRALSRAVPKSSLRPITSRPYSAISRRTTNALRPSWTAISRPTYRSFTTTPLRRAADDDGVSTELSAKIEQELSYEKASGDIEQLNEALQSFIDTSGFEIQDTPGSEEVILTRQSNGETVKVTFSIADLNALNEESDELSEDPALDDEGFLEDLESQSSGSHTKGAINSGRTPDGNFKVAPEDRVAPGDRPELADSEDLNPADDEEIGAGFAVRVNVTVTKASGGALQFETVASDGLIDIENVYYFSAADVADAQTAEKDFQRSGIYAGPPFENLDDQLRPLFSRYLKARGVNEDLAQFIPDYIEFKEQKEYLRWLDGVKNFVNA